MLQPYVGIKHLTSVMFLTTLFQKCLWLLLVICVMIQMGLLRNFCDYFKKSFAFSVHPRYKHDVGYRLSRSGLAIAYGQQVEFQGPIVQSVTHSSTSQTVNITYTAVSSIELRNPNGFDV